MADFEQLINLNLTTLNKNDLKTKASELQKALKDISDRSSSSSSIENVMLRLQLLETKQTSNIADIQRLQNENKSLKKRISDLEKFSDEDMGEIEDRFIEIEKAVANCEQYTRRENFEISGIPESVPDDEIEEHVLDIVNTITNRREGQHILAKDIHASHRLKKEPGDQAPKVIVRMVNRKHTIDVLKNKKMSPEQQEKLKYDNIFINENLCATNKRLLEQARDLKKKGVLKRCWTFNGITHIKIKETDARGKKIFHMCDFEKFFSPTELGWE